MRWGFSANTGFLWRERTFLDRIGLAAACGFDAVEFHDDAQAADPAALADALAKAGLPVLGLNVRMGEHGGCAAIPAMAGQARRDIDEAVETAARVGARAVHVLAGRTDESGARRAYVTALRHALAVSDLTILIEPLSPGAVPGYFLDSLDKAVGVIGEIGDSRLKLLFDCFHVAAIHGDPQVRFREVATMVGHVQIASWPGRAEPDATGPDYAALLPAMRRAGYHGLFGCEYNPATTVEAGLGWRDELLRRLGG